MMVEPRSIPNYKPEQTTVLDERRSNKFRAYVADSEKQQINDLLKRTTNFDNI